MLTQTLASGVGLKRELEVVHRSFEVSQLPQRDTHAIVRPSKARRFAMIDSFLVTPDGGAQHGWYGRRREVGLQLFERRLEET